MTTPQSANERIRRKLRSKKIGPSVDKDMTGRIVVKKHANNDPNRNHSDDHNKRRHTASEEFLKFYRGGDVEDPTKFRKLVENMIDIAIEAGGKVAFPFKLDRLCELRESIGEIPYVIIKQVMEPRDIEICPICNEEIGEKALFLPEDQRGPSISSPEWMHRSCGGRFKYEHSEVSDEILDFLKNK